MIKEIQIKNDYGKTIFYKEIKEKNIDLIYKNIDNNFYFNLDNEHELIKPNNNFYAGFITKNGVLVIMLKMV